MERLFSLDNRLKTCASLVPYGARLVDVGTDHAYLPVWLLKNNRISYAVASDINQKPLDSGRLTAEKYQTENIEFRLGPGLETLSRSDNIDTAVIAGMGGEIIREIIGGSKLAENLTLILQPMTKSEVLIKYLCDNGFDIITQVCAGTGSKYYTILKAKYTGDVRKKDKSFFYLGKLDLSDETCKKFVQNHIKNLENKSKGDSSLLPLIKELKEKLR